MYGVLSQTLRAGESSPITAEPLPPHPSPGYSANEPSSPQENTGWGTLKVSDNLCGAPSLRSQSHLTRVASFVVPPAWQLRTIDTCRKYVPGDAFVNERRLATAVVAVRPITCNRLSLH